MTGLWRCNTSNQTQQPDPEREPFSGVKPASGWAACLGQVTLAAGPAAVFLLLLGLGCGGSGSGNDGSQVPDLPYCNPVADWSEEWQAWEARIVQRMNQARAAGATCGTTTYDPTDPLEADPALRCASRAHSKDMSDRGFFDHTNPDGDGPTERFHKAGWSGSTWGENIVGGYGSADAQFDGWMSSPGHCGNIMNPSFTQVGVGYFQGAGEYRDYTTAGFGRP